MAKAERQLSEEVKAAAAAVPKGASSKKKMRIIANAFIRARLISAQEAIHNVLGLPYVSKSRGSLFLPNGRPGTRFRMKLPAAQLALLDEDCKDVYRDGIIQHYEKRTTKGCTADVAKAIEQMSLITFAACYDMEVRRKADGEEGRDSAQQQLDETPDEQEQREQMDESFREDDEEEEGAKTRRSKPKSDVPEELPKRIVLSSGRVMKKRRRMKIVRWRRIDPEAEPEDYAYSFLLFYLPFVGKEEEKLSLDATKYKSYHEWLLAVKDQLLDISNTFEALSDNKVRQFQESEQRKVG